MWFLKENGRNCGQGIDIVRTAAEALTLAVERETEMPGREYVLQPHVAHPYKQIREAIAKLLVRGALEREGIKYG